MYASSKDSPTLGSNAVQNDRLRHESWSNRLEGLIDTNVRNKRVAVIGCGSVGSYMAEELVRSGISELVLIDPDIVEWPNLTRTVFGYRDVGKPKVLALKESLDTIFPDLQILPLHNRMQQLRDERPDVFNNIDLMVSAVDDPAANGAVNRLCFKIGIPSVFIGIYRAAKGGEVIFIDPVRTPCFHCATGGVREALAGAADANLIERVRDYHTNRLIGEVALGADIHFVTAAAAKIVLSVLAQHGSSPLAAFTQAKFDDGGNYLMLGMSPSYYLFPKTHAGAVGQHAFQSVWVSTERRETCEVCNAVADI